MDEVYSWLTQHKLDMFENIFVNNGYDELDIIGETDESDLDAMNITLPSHRKKILLWVQQLRKQACSQEGKQH